MGQDLTSDVKTALWSVDFPNSQHGWTVGEAGVMLHTEDGGGAWWKQSDREHGSACGPLHLDASARLGRG